MDEIIRKEVDKIIENNNIILYDRIFCVVYPTSISFYIDSNENPLGFRVLTFEISIYLNILENVLVYFKEPLLLDAYSSNSDKHYTVLYKFDTQYSNGILGTSENNNMVYIKDGDYIIDYTSNNFKVIDEL